MASLVSILQNMRQAARGGFGSAAPPVFGAAQAHAPVAAHGGPMNLTLPAGFQLPPAGLVPGQHAPGAASQPFAPDAPLTPAQATAVAALTGGTPRYVQSPGAGAADQYNPAARAYAKQRLLAAVRSGAIPRYLPEWDADPALAWRGVSQLMSQSGYFNPASRAQIASE